MSGPSEKAIEAAQAAAFPSATPRSPHPGIRRAVDAAHDQVLGLDRSVCLRDVVEKIRNEGEYACGGFEADAAAWVSRMFGVQP